MEYKQECVETSQSFPDISLAFFKNEGDGPSLERLILRLRPLKVSLLEVFIGAASRFARSTIGPTVSDYVKC